MNHHTAIVCVGPVCNVPVCNDLSMTETDGVVYDMEMYPCEGRDNTVRDMPWMTLGEAWRLFCHGTCLPPCDNN